MVTKPIRGDQTESLYEQARSQLENLVRSATPRATEAVLADLPGLVGDQEFLLELVYLEFVLRQELGVDCSRELAERFPQLGPELEKLLEVDRAINKSDDTRRSTDDTMTPTQAIKPPSRLHFGPYLLLDAIGQGGMGVVYRAQQRGLNRIVAIKTLNFIGQLNQGSVARFQAEAEVIAKLQHPNIVQVFEAGIDRDVPYYSMEYISGGTLATAIAESTMQPQIAARLIEKLAQAVAYAHSMGVVHRDLKPANVLLAPSSLPGALSIQPHIKNSTAIVDAFEPKIADFGLAKKLDEDSQLSQTGSVLGTPSYMAPEQTESGPNAASPACDVYSLGAILYHVLVGRPPFVAATAIDTLRKLREEEPVPLRNLDPKIPLDLETICLTCLSKEPRRRYASADALAEDLNRYLKDRSILARRSSWISKTTKLARRHPAIASLIVVSLIASICMTGLWLRAEANRALADRASDLASRAVYAQTIRLAQFDLKQGDWQSAISRLEETNPEYRKFEWQLLRRQASGPVFIQSTPLLSTSVSISPDGKWIAGGQRGAFGTDEVGECRVWEIATGREVYRFGGHPGGVGSVSFSPDGQYIATGGVIFGDKERMGGLQVWRTSDGQRHFADDQADVYSLTFSPDGKSLAIGGYKGSRIDVYSTKDGSKIKTWRAHSRFVTDLEYSPDGKLLASVGRDGVLHVWSMVKGIAHPQIVGDNNFKDLRRLDWSKDGKTIFISDYRRAIFVFTLRDDGRVIQTELVESPGINVVRVSPDNQYLATSGEGRLSTIHDRFTQATQGSVNAYGNTLDIAFDRPGRHIAVATGHSVQVWDLDQCLHKSTLAASPSPDVTAIDGHPFEDQVALAYGINYRRREAKGEPRFDLVDNQTGRAIRSFIHGDNWPSCVTFSSDGERIVSGDEAGRVRIWNAKDGKLQSNIDGHKGAVVGALIPSNSGEFITCGEDSLLCAWSVQSGELSKKKELGEHPIQLSGSRLGTTLALLTDRSAVHLFDIRTLRGLGQIPSKAKDVSTIKVSEDGKWIAIANKNREIEVWDLKALSERRVSEPTWIMRGHTFDIVELVFSHDGSRLASAGQDMTVRLWDLTSGHELINLAMSIEALQPRMVFSRDDRALRVWDLSQRYHWEATNQLEPIAGVADKEWHVQQLAMAQRSNRNLHELAVHNHFAQQFHLTRLMELEPTGGWQRQRGLVRQLAGEHQGAYDDFLAVRAKLAPNLETAKTAIQERLKSLANPQTWKDDPKKLLQKLTTVSVDVPLLSCMAQVALKLGKMDEYRQWCTEMEAAYQSDKSISNLNSFAWAVGLSSSSDQVEYAKIIQYFKDAGASAQQPIYLNTLALVEYQAGEYASALKLCEQGIKKSQKTNAPLDWIIAGLCHAKLSNLDAACQMRDEVEQWSKNQQFFQSTTIKGFGAAESNALPAMILLQELDELIENNIVAE